MKYILNHLNGTIKNFKSEDKLRDFARDNYWSINDIESLLRTNSILGWNLKIIPQTNKEIFNLLWDEVENAYYGSDYDGDLEYFVKNDYRFLAVNSWQNSGASKYNFSAKIPKYRMKEDLKHFKEFSDYFVCPTCNHTGFYDYDENIDYKDFCRNCHKTVKMESHKNILKAKNLLKNIAS